MLNSKEVLRTERIWIKNNTTIQRLTHISKNLYNEGNYIVRQAYFKEKRWVKYPEIRENLRESENYQKLPESTAEKILRIVDKNWKSFFKSQEEWKQQGLLLPKPTLSTNQMFTFWICQSLHNNASALPGLYGGHKINYNQNKHEKKEKTTRKNARSKLVLVDLELDSKELMDELKRFHLDIKRIWDFVGDIVQYELIEVCTSQYVDLIVTTNDRLLTRSEEWLKYLLPHRTRLCIVSKELLSDPNYLASMINQRICMKRSRSKKNSEKNPTILVHDKGGTQ